MDWLLWLIRCARGEGADHRGTLAFLPTFHVIGYTNNFLYNLTVGARCFLREVWPLPRAALAANLQAAMRTARCIDGPPRVIATDLLTSLEMHPPCLLRTRRRPPSRPRSCSARAPS